jgi:type IV secretion system protein VirB9
MPGDGDVRIQSVAYSSGQVVQLNVVPGYAMMVALAPGERIETIALGDSSGWQATATKRGDALFVKADGAVAATNMTVVTDARTYAFELLPDGGDGAAYLVRFTYPAPAETNLTLPDKEPSIGYRLRGNRALLPRDLKVSGETVAMRWPDSATLPAIYTVDDSNGEAVADARVTDGWLVFNGLAKRFVFRLDGMSASANRMAARRSRR